jgi:hypothetical protein
MSSLGSANAMRGARELKRAGATIDHEHDLADRAAGWVLDCPIILVRPGLATAACALSNMGKEASPR